MSRTFLPNHVVQCLFILCRSITPAGYPSLRRWYRQRRVLRVPGSPRFFWNSVPAVRWVRQTGRLEIVGEDTATALRIAEKNLADSRGLAPFDGVITQKLRDRGDYVGAGTALFMLDDPRVREVCLLLSADRYADVTVGKTEIETSFGQRLPVTYKAPTVNAVSRTFEIRAVLKPDPAVAPGMLCTARVVFASRKGSGVPAGAVGLRDGKTVVFVVTTEGTVSAVEVRKGASAHGMTEILNPEALGNAQIVSEGMLLLNPGDAVKAVR